MSLSSSSSRSPADVFAPVVSSLSKRFASSQYHRSEEHTSELQSRLHLVCRLLLEKKKEEPCKNFAGLDNYTSTSTIPTANTPGQHPYVLHSCLNYIPAHIPIHSSYSSRDALSRYS